MSQSLQRWATELCAGKDLTQSVSSVTLSFLVRGKSMSRVLSVLPHFFKSIPSCLHRPCHVRPSNFFLERAPWSPSQHVWLPIPFPFHAVCKSFLSGVRWDHNSQAVWFGASCRTLPSSVTCMQELPCVVSVCFSWCSLAHRLPILCFPGSDLNGPVIRVLGPVASSCVWPVGGTLTKDHREREKSGCCICSPGSWPAGQGNGSG